MPNLKLLHGDCLELMKDIPDGSIDLILCDLPYGTTQCKWDVVIPFEPLWEQYWRILKPNGAIVLFGCEPFSSHLRMSQIKYYKYDWVWKKSNPSNIANSNYEPMRYTEHISIFYKQRPLFNKQLIERDEKGKQRILAGQKNNITFKTTTSLVSSSTAGETSPHKYSAEYKNPSNILEFKVERGRNRFHPTQKPVALLEYLIKTYTNEGETVLDNCMGSGSTGVACINTKRAFIGMEKEENYFDIAVNRIQETIKGSDK